MQHFKKQKERKTFSSSRIQIEDQVFKLYGFLCFFCWNWWIYLLM